MELSRPQRRLRYDNLPDDIEKLKEMAKDLQQQGRRFELELGVRQVTLEMVKNRTPTRTG